MAKVTELATAELVRRATTMTEADSAAKSEEWWQLVGELQRRPEDEVFRAAVGWCAASEAALRCLGADVLGQLGYEASLPFALQSVPVLSALFNDATPEVIASALVACGHLGVGDSAAICELAGHGEAGVRLAVAICLGGRESSQALSTLVALTADADRDVRNWATFGLGSVSARDTPAIRDALLARLSEADDEIRGEAILGLVRRGDRRVTGDATFMPELEALLADNPGDRDILDVLARLRAAG